MTWSATQDIIVWQVRAPRVLLSAVVGATLSVTGVALFVARVGGRVTSTRLLLTGSGGGFRYPERGPGGAVLVAGVAGLRPVVISARRRTSPAGSRWRASPGPARLGTDRRRFLIWADVLARVAFQP